MSEKAVERYEKTKNVGPAKIGQKPPADPIYDKTDNKDAVKAAGPRERKEEEKQS